MLCLVLTRPAESAVHRPIAAVFMYHHVSQSVAPGPYARALTVTPAEFAHQLEWLQRRRCVVLSLGGLIDALNFNARESSSRGSKDSGMSRCMVALTFDDGYADAASVALPLLRRHGDVGTFFIASGLLGKPGHLSALGVRLLASNGMQIGAHTVHHPDLTTLSGGRLTDEVRTPAATLSKLTATVISAFAYPAGSTNSRVEAAVRAAGYRYAVTTTPGRLSAARFERDPFALPRFRVSRGQGTVLLSAVLGPAHETYGVMNVTQLVHIARRRIEGNDPQTAEAIAVSLLARAFSEQILKVHVLKAAGTTVVGIMLSGAKFRHAITSRGFESDVQQMISAAFAQSASLSEVDVWAVIPLVPAPNAPVSGDYAVPTNRIVYSTAGYARPRALGKTYWDGAWRSRVDRTQQPR